VIYGPFAAQYPGNSMGEVIEITTRMPDKFEVNAQADGALQSFSQYATKDTYSTYQMSAGIGDRVSDFAFRLSANHLDTYGQPLSYVTLTRPTSASNAGTPVSGAFTDLNRTGVPIAVLGAGGLEHQIQDNVTLKLAYDFNDKLTANYTLGLFNQTDNATVQSYLHDPNGTPVYAGSVNIGGYNYVVGPSTFSNAVSRYGQSQLAQGLSFKFSDGDWDATLALSRYDFLRDLQRVPTAVLPSAFDGGAGSITQMDGTGWYTIDAKAGHFTSASNSLSFGAHYDRYKLALRKFSTSDWRSGPRGALANASRSSTTTCSPSCATADRARSPTSGKNCSAASTSSRRCNRSPPGFATCAKPASADTSSSATTSRRAFSSTSFSRASGEGGDDWPYSGELSRV